MALGISAEDKGWLLTVFSTKSGEEKKSGTAGQDIKRGKSSKG
jgi:hypothetical protein